MAEEQKTLTDSKRKLDKKDDSAKYSKTRLSIGDEYDRWTELKLLIAVITQLLGKLRNCSRFIINHVFFFFSMVVALYMYSIMFWIRVSVSVMVFNATFNNISVILPRSVLLAEKMGVPEKTAASH
jgi:hypothetical protein